MTEMIKSLVSPLKFPPRTISCFKSSNETMDAAGFAVGSVEGRVAIQYERSLIQIFRHLRLVLEATLAKLSARKPCLSRKRVQQYMYA